MLSDCVTGGFFFSQSFQGVRFEERHVCSNYVTWKGIWTSLRGFIHMERHCGKRSSQRVRLKKGESPTESKSLKTYSSAFIISARSSKMCFPCAPKDPREAHFSFSPHHRATTVAQNHYNMIKMQEIQEMLTKLFY